ncbi:MAG: NTP transferase domain-containing protein [Coprobacillus sp.]|nr:NTP transferase domain-containing protein [Coprobacillus sp.]
MSEPRYAIIIAAGKGRKMVTKEKEHSKVSYPILGRPIIKYVLDALKPLHFDKTITVVGFGGDVTSEIVKKRSEVVWQKELNGTAKAALCAKPLLKDKEGKTLIVFGDMPLLTSETLEKLFKKNAKDHEDLTLLTAMVDNAYEYARVVRDPKSRHILKIIDDKNRQAIYDNVHEINAGIYLVDNKLLFKYLAKIEESDEGKYNIGDMVESFVNDGLKVGAYVLEDATEIYAVSTRVQLATAAKIMKDRVNRKLMLSGVSMEDPKTTYISPNVRIGEDTIIMPNTTIFGHCNIGCANRIGPNVYIAKTDIGEGNNISFSSIATSTIGDHNHIGPFVKIEGQTIGSDETIGK